jgi:hypothetical protein
MIIRKKIFTKKEIQIIKNFILKEEENIKSLGKSGYKNSSSDALTGRYDIYNFLNSKIGPLLLNKIVPFLDSLNFFKPLSIQCWANTFRKGEGIPMHKHSNGLHYFYCANIFISGKNNIGTFYVKENESHYSRNKSVKNIVKKFNNIPGEIFLFDCFCPHYVEPNPTNEVRISMAMDIYENTIFNNDDRFFVIK